MFKLWFIIGMIAALFDAAMSYKEDGINHFSDEGVFKKTALKVLGGPITFVQVFMTWRIQIKAGFIKLKKWFEE